MQPVGTRGLLLHVQIKKIMSTIPRIDSLILIDDFSAKIFNINNEVLGTHVLGNINERVEQFTQVAYR